jgi:ferredoxin
VVSATEELLFLKLRAQALILRLDRLNRRLGSLQQGEGASLSVAVVDPQKCLGCGLCEKACPVGTVSVNEAASVEPELCIGCGRCISQCPQGAIQLRPASLPREGRPRHSLRHANCTLSKQKRRKEERIMPRGDGTGPRGQGPGTGRGGGRGRGGGTGRGGGMGRGGGFAAGPGGYCVCPSCGERTPHQLGSPCYQLKCPKCGAVMTRE